MNMSVVVIVAPLRSTERIKNNSNNNKNKTKYKKFHLRYALYLIHAHISTINIYYHTKYYICFVLLIFFFLFSTRLIWVFRFHSRKTLNSRPMPAMTISLVNERVKNPCRRNTRCGPNGSHPRDTILNYYTHHSFSMTFRTNMHLQTYTFTTCSRCYYMSSLMLVCKNRLSNKWTTRKHTNLNVEL